MYLFCLLVWGLNFIAVKIQGTPVSLEESLTYRLAGALVLFLAYAAYARPARNATWQDTPFIILFGLCNFALSYLLLYYATIWSTAALVTLVFSMKAMMTPIALAIFLRDPLDKRIILGGCISILGVGTLLYPSLAIGTVELLGLGLAVIGTAITALGDAASARNARRGIDPVYANCIGFLAATALIFTVGVFQGRPFDLPTSVSYLGALFYLTVVASFFAWLFYLKLVGKIGAANSGFMVALFPAIGGIASVMLGESEPTIFLTVGCILSCVGAGYALGGFDRLRQGTSNWRQT